MITKKLPSTLTLSLISVFAALNFIVNVIPVTPILGVPGTHFRLGWVLAPLTGIILGPLAGGVSCTLASLLGLFIGVESWAFGPFSPFRAGLSALQSGLLTRGRWKLALLILTVLILSWVTLPSGRDALIVVSFHLLAGILIVLFNSKIRDYAHSPDLNKVSLGIAIASYCGNISRHLFGNTLLVLLSNLPAIIFITAIPLTIIEQTTFTIASTLLGTTVTRTRLRELLDF